MCNGSRVTDVADQSIQDDIEHDDSGPLCAWESEAKKRAPCGGGNDDNSEYQTQNTHKGIPVTLPASRRDYAPCLSGGHPDAACDTDEQPVAAPVFDGKQHRVFVHLIAPGE